MAASSAADLLHTYDIKTKALSDSIVQLQELIDAASASFELLDEGDLSYGLLSEILSSAKEEKDRHQHNLRIARRRQEKRRLAAGEQATAEAVPEKEKARHLIDFLISNGLVDVRRHAAVVIKAFVSGFLARQRSQGASGARSMDPAGLLQTYFDESERGGVFGDGSVHSALVSQAFMRGFLESSKFHETGDETKAPLTMAIINVTGDDLFGKKDTASGGGEATVPVEDETLRREIPLLVKQIEATMQEIERAVQLLKHALDLERVRSTSKGMTPSSSQHRSQGRPAISTKASRLAELQKAKAHAAEALERAARFGDQTHHVNPRSPPAGLSPTAGARMLRSPKLATPYAAASSSATGASANGYSSSHQHVYATPKPRGSSSPSTHTGGGVSSATSRGRHLTPSTVTAPTLSSSLKMSAPAAAAASSSIQKSVSPTSRRFFDSKANNTTHRRSSPVSRHPNNSNNKETISQTPSHPHNTPSTAGGGGGYTAAKSSARASSSPKSPIVAECERRTATMLNMYRASHEDDDNDNDDAYYYRQNGDADSSSNIVDGAIRDVWRTLEAEDSFQLEAANRHANILENPGYRQPHGSSLAYAQAPPPPPFTARDHQVQAQRGTAGLGQHQHLNTPYDRQQDEAAAAAPLSEGEARALEALEKAQAIALAARSYDNGRYSNSIEGAVGKKTVPPPPLPPPSFEQLSAAAGPVRGSSSPSHHNSSFYAEAYSALAAPQSTARASALSQRSPHALATAAVAASLQPQATTTTTTSGRVTFEQEEEQRLRHRQSSQQQPQQQQQQLRFEGPGGHPEGPWQYFDAQHQQQQSQHIPRPSSSGSIPPPKTPPGSPPVSRTTLHEPPNTTTAFYMQPTASRQSTSAGGGGTRAVNKGKGPKASAHNNNKASSKGVWRSGAAKGSVGLSVAEARAQQEASAKVQRDAMAARSRARRAGTSATGLLVSQAEVSERLHKGRHVQADELPGGTNDRLENPLGAAFRDLAKASSRPSRRNATGAGAAHSSGVSTDDDDNDAVFAAASDILNTSRDAARREANESNGASPSKAPAYVGMEAANFQQWQRPR